MEDKPISKKDILKELDETNQKTINIVMVEY